MQNLGVGKGGGSVGVNKVHYALCKNGELRVVELIPSFRVKKV